MECREATELLDAYALGAADSVESRVVEKHIEECADCWRALDNARHAASLLALTVPLAAAPGSLKERVVTGAKSEANAKVDGGAASIWGRPGIGAFAMGVTAAGVAAIVIVALLLLRMNDIDSDRDAAARQAQNAQEALDSRTQAMALLVMADLRYSPIPPTSPGSSTLGVYYWSKEAGKGLLVCRDLPDLEDGLVYQAWFRIGGRLVSAGAFEYGERVEQLVIDLRPMTSLPEWMGVTIEPESGSEQPSGDFLVAGTLRGQ